MSLGKNIKTCSTCKGEKEIKTKRRGRAVVTRCPTCKGGGYQTNR